MNDIVCKKYFQNQPSIQYHQEVSDKQLGQKKYDGNKQKMRVKTEKDGKQGGGERCRKKMKGKTIRGKTFQDDEQKAYPVTNSTDAKQGPRPPTRSSVAVPRISPQPAPRKQWQSGYVSPVTRLRPLGKVDRFKEQCRGVYIKKIENMSTVLNS